MFNNKSDIAIIFMILLIFLVQSGLKVRVMHAVLKDKTTQPCQLQK